MVTSLCLPSLLINLSELILFLPCLWTLHLVLFLSFVTVDNHGNTLEFELLAGEAKFTCLCVSGGAPFMICSMLQLVCLIKFAYATSGESSWSIIESLFSI